MSEKITPLPWTAHKGSLLYAQTEDGEPCVAVTRYDKQAFYALPLSADECAANAAYIVEACNAYPALTARVKELEDALAGLLDVAKWTEEPWDTDEYRAAEALLKGDAKWVK